MGICFSNTKISGSNSTTPSATAGQEQENRLIVKHEVMVPNVNLQRIKDLNRYHHRKQQDTNYNNKNRAKGKAAPKRPKVIPCGKRTDFGYLKDFDRRYSTGKLLGHGQFGYTYVAIDKSTGDRVAVKKIEKNKVISAHSDFRMNMLLPIAVEDVKREVKILRALSGHENVVQFHNAFEDNSFVYIVMEKDGRYTEKDAAVVVRQMLRVAAQCHLHGLVHRDMKPENFLFKSPNVDSHLKATDFGLSDFIRPGKKFTDIVGSAYYVAPEVLKRRSGPESDVWSIGVISYILLCGRRPFWDRTEDGIKKQARFPSQTMADYKQQCQRSSKEITHEKSPCKTHRCTGAIRHLMMRKTCTAHPWVREDGNASEIPLDISVLSNMRQFVKYNRLKQFALRALASTLGEEEISDLKDQFHAIDVDKNGAISLEEMRQALAKDIPWKMKESRVLEILEAVSRQILIVFVFPIGLSDRIDSNTDGIVDFMEFVAATLHVHQLEEHNNEKWQRLSKAAFEQFDFDRDGYITAEELKMHTGLRGSINPLLEEADVDKDGKISLSEFRRLLRTASMS
ncbi:Calcium-binding EF-hand [Cynara cardunculus var. scolymus]|uniref:Calcium-binding EF-hand n=1 Tax=Cynara cardunculus var. scolymus TaxID=59895 RepID=A0A103Y5K0_CYNCS|nr:Calcium-binding EF-hand [Cynara cardunculus var. scolymus]